jgi:fatty acid desaturase
MFSGVSERLRAYEETRARVTARLADLRAEQKRINWLGVAAIVAAAVARAFGFVPMIVTGIFGATLFFVGHYVVYMHIHESKLTLRQLKKSLASMK